MNKYIYAAALMGVMTLASCQKEEAGIDFNSDPEAVKINATVGNSIFSRSNPTGDVAAQKVFNSGDKIGVSADAQAAVTYTFDGAKWIPATGTYLKWTQDAMNFTAYYPVTTGTDAQNFTLPTDQSDLPKIAAADYMTATSVSKNKSEGDVSLSLSRKTARIIVKIAGFNDQYTEDQKYVKDVSFNTFALAYKEGTVTSEVTSQVITPYCGNETSVTGGYGVGTTFTALVLPDAAHVDDFIALTDGTGKSLTVKGIPAHEAGKSYTYNVTVGKNKLEVGSVTVDDWTTGTPITGGEALPCVMVDPATHTITANKPGYITATDITEALAGGTVLTVAGEINSNDVTLLVANATTLTGIDLRSVTYSEQTIPAADWSKCANLTKIVINKEDVETYETTWSTASDKLFYVGKELTYKIDDMTGDYVNGIPCVVIGITDINKYKLISRNPYYGYADEMYLPGNGTYQGLVYNTMTTVITPWQGTVATLADMEALLPLRPTSFIIVTAAENGDRNTDISGNYFVVNSDNQGYVTSYSYSDNKFNLFNYNGDMLDKLLNYYCAFITFEVTNN